MMLCHESIREEGSGLAPTDIASETDAMMKQAAALKRISIAMHGQQQSDSFVVQQGYAELVKFTKKEVYPKEEDVSDNSNLQCMQRLVKLALAESSQQSKPVFISWQACEGGGGVDNF